VLNDNMPCDLIHVKVTRPLQLEIISFLRAKAGTAVACLHSACLSHRNSVCPFVCHMGGSVKKTVRARITKSSLSAAWKTSFRSRKAFL